jgi:hypothetical protein
MPLSVTISGEAFREKVLQALDYWAKNRPAEARQFVRDCKERRDRTELSKDIKPAFTAPSFVVDLLRNSEWQTKFAYGTPCGTGNKLWDSDPELQDIFMSCMPESMTSAKKRQGAPFSRA